ncbi:MAG: c-type cytochrome [Sphingomonadaceae bacterium]
MTISLKTMLASAFALAALAAPAAAQQLKIGNLTGDPARGQAAFAPCRACHVTQPGVNRVGPSLHGIIGRRAGTVPGFNYSAANKNSGVTWTPQVMFTYLENPRKFMPGTKMAYAGLKDPQKRADLIAWLATQK